MEFKRRPASRLTARSRSYPLDHTARQLVEHHLGVDVGGAARAYRGVTSATMQYDNLLINDVFRKVDERTVLGVMDLKGVRAPLLFVLRRE